jgi:hypothetical protein
MRASDIDYLRESSFNEVVEGSGRVGSLGLYYNERKAAYHAIFDEAQKIYGGLNQTDCEILSRRAIKRRFMNRLVVVGSDQKKPSGLIPAFVWAWVIRYIATWIVDKIIDHIFSNYR